MGFFRKKNEYAQYAGGMDPAKRVVLPQVDGKTDKNSILSREELYSASMNSRGSSGIFGQVAKDNQEAAMESNKQERTDRNAALYQKSEIYKRAWDKDGIIQYKTEYIAILQRKWGSQVQFIVAFDELTKEGYRLMAIDEGKRGSTDNWSGGVNAYFYFQKMEYVR